MLCVSLRRYFGKCGSVCNDLRTHIQKTHAAQFTTPHNDAHDHDDDDNDAAVAVRHCRKFRGSIHLAQKPHTRARFAEIV